MSEPRHISPILDGFTLGQLLSRSSTAACYQATQNHTGLRFVVKIISLPASTQQLDSFLL